MKKGILLLVTCLTLGFCAQAQTLSKQDVKKVSEEINENIAQIERAIKKTDWKQVQNVVDKTALTLEKNAESFVQIIENIDIAKLVITMTKIATDIENNVDLQKLEKAFERIGTRVEKAVVK